MKYLAFAMVLVLLIACDEKTLSSSIEKDIQALKTVKLQKQFLEQIWDIDQQVRHDESSAVQKFGYDSKEHQEAIQSAMQTDELNLQKIETYLRVYGYPSKEKHGKKAVGTPWIVVHHASGGVAPRHRNFRYIYRAYKNKDVDDGALTFYLNRMYEMKFGYRIEWNRPFRVEEELDTLLKSLELEMIAEEIDLIF